MTTFHPCSAKASNGLFRAMVQLRTGNGPSGRMAGSKVSADTFETKDDARNWARHAAHNAVAFLEARGYSARVA